MITWLPVNSNYAQGVNVAEQDGKPDSLLTYYRRLIAVRQATPALLAGDYTPLHPAEERYLAFLRTTPEQRCLVALNFTAEPVTTSVAPGEATRLRTIFSSHPRSASEEDPAHLTLAPFEAYIGAVLP